MDLQAIINDARQATYGKTGYVALLGRPNTGKSTLLNTLLNRHLAAVSNKPQTTRKFLLGILTDEDSQILFLDAPGIHVAKLAIDEAMDESIKRVMEDADVVVCMIDPTRPPGEEDLMAATCAANARKPTILAVNKVDQANEEQIAENLRFFQERMPEAPHVRIVALERERALVLLEQIKALLPEGPFMYDADELTDVYERDIAAEMIREVLLTELKQEIPHCIAVTIDTWKEQENKIAVQATLNIERENHKGIILGQGGKMIKLIRKLSIQKISEFCGQRIDLKLFVKVVPDWRKRKQFLKEIKLMES